MKTNKRLKLIREAATEEADGDKWRKRMDRWMDLVYPRPAWTGFTFHLDQRPLRFNL